MEDKNCITQLMPLKWGQKLPNIGDCIKISPNSEEMEIIDIIKVEPFYPSKPVGVILTIKCKKL